MNRRAKLEFLSLCGVLAFAVACDEEKPAGESAAAPQASATAAAPSPSAAPAPTPTVAKTAERPERVDTALTAERRTAIETKYPKAKGFVVGLELEDTLKANKAIKDKKAAVAAFDKLAKGKWVLFSGPLVNLTDTGFDVGVTYTPQLENDPIGMSRQFFEVTLSEVAGYAKDKFKAGNVVVVLAKYDGAAKAGPGDELVAAGAWQ